MGMFSWKCKGCGHELKEGEYVRLNGCVGEYDGYGRAGGFSYDDEEPSCWHVRCYKNASDQEKLDDSPSRYAPNQGFGCACLENKKNYEPEAKTTFQPVIFVDHYDDRAEKTTKQQWYVVDGVLVDQYHYEALYEAANGEGGITEKIYDEQSDDWYKTTSDEEKNAFYQKIEEMVENHIGMKRPRTNAKWFDDFEEAKRTVEVLIPSLPNPDWGYELAIYGKQEKAEGLYYKYNKTPKWDAVPIPGEFYPHGGQKNDYVFNGTFDEEIAFVHGRPAVPADLFSDKVKSY
jgi:hypothetical protein